jgi:uncharacterized protein YjdB
MKSKCKLLGFAVVMAAIVFCFSACSDGSNTVPVSGVSLDKTSISLTIGGTETLTATVSPSDADNKAVTWTSSDDNVATVDKGVVTAVAAGPATITVTTKDGGKTAQCTVTVTSTIAVTGVTLNQSTLNLTVGGTTTLTATVAPANASNKAVTWTSSDNNVATVNNGAVSAVAAGTATITVTTADGNKMAACTVTVNPANSGDVAVTGVTLDQSTLSLTAGDTATLTATVAPADATNKAVTWTSSDIGIATVTDGAVSAVAVGTATITVTTEDGGKTAQCTVTVTPVIAVTGVTLQATLSLAAGAIGTLTATVQPTNATNKAVTWTSSDNNVATVNNGAITAVGAGSATITVTTADGGKTAQCTVTVTVIDVTGVALNKTSLSLIVGETETLTAEFTPPNATNKTVSWSSDDSAIVTVSETGLVTPVKSGTTTITVTTDDGDYTAHCAVTIYSADMARIPAGTFIMGSPETEPNRSSDEAQHSVTLTKNFYMGRYQVTQAQYQTVMGAGEDRTTDTYGKGDNYPVYYINWYDAIVFCNKLSIMEGLNPVYSIGGSTDPSAWGTIPTSDNATWNDAVMDASRNGYRLPTEAEWEYACRGDYQNKTTETNTKPFGIGDGTKMTDSMANFNGRNPYDLAQSGQYSDPGGTYVGKTTAVGSYEPNNYGLYDMHGNLWEWCWDWYGSYSSKAQTDPIGAASGDYRVLRGGSWYDNASGTRSVGRGNINPSKRDSNIGFRLIRP